MKRLLIPSISALTVLSFDCSVFDSSLFVVVDFLASTIDY